MIAARLISRLSPVSSAKSIEISSGREEANRLSRQPSHSPPRPRRFLMQSAKSRLARTGVYILRT